MASSYDFSHEYDTSNDERVRRTVIEHKFDETDRLDEVLYEIWHFLQHCGFSYVTGLTAHKDHGDVFVGDRVAVRRASDGAV